MRAAAARWRALAAGLAVAVGLGGGAQAQSPGSQDVPAAWTAYAEQVTATVSSWLSEEADPAVRLRRSLLESAPSVGQSASLEVKLWIDAEGGVSRIAAIPSGGEDVQADLQAFVAGRRFQRPPPGMTQPLRLALDIKPEADAGDATRR